jgi:enamine deaminase RidA (YjgF/YER057c/UK114 family)
METQMRQTYANATKILGEFGATLENVVEEVLYVTDMDRAFAVAGAVRKEAYGLSGHLKTGHSWSPQNRPTDEPRRWII